MKERTIPICRGTPSTRLCLYLKKAGFDLATIKQGTLLAITRIAIPGHFKVTTKTAEQHIIQGQHQGHKYTLQYSRKGSWLLSRDDFIRQQQPIVNDRTNTLTSKPSSVSI